MLDENNVDTAESADAPTEGQNTNSDTTNTNGEQVEKPQDADKSKTNQDAAKTHSQSDVNRIVTRETKKAVDKALADKAAEDARKAQEDQGQFKPLYDAEKAKNETNEKELTSLRELANEQIDSTIKDWPKEFQELIPDAESASPADRLALVKRTAPAVALVKNAKPQAPNLDGDRGGNSTILETPEAKQAAARMGRL